jgi:hypothetical protein
MTALGCSTVESLVTVVIAPEGWVRHPDEDSTAVKSERGDNVTGNLRSGLLAGLISSVIWMIISTAVGMGKAPVIIGGMACLIGTGLITSAISGMTARRRIDPSVH